MKKPVLTLSFVSVIVGVLVSSSPSQAQTKQTRKSSGNISTIVMNAVSGRSAAGMIVELFEVSGKSHRKITQASTGEDGRVDLISSSSLPLGKYELRFQVGDYFRKQGAAVGDPAILDFVPIRFSVTNPAGRYHVPLICTPSSYTTYRGS